MEINRRDMVSAASAFAVLAFAADRQGFAEALQNEPTHAVDIAEYWSSFYDDASTRGAKGSDVGLAVKSKRTMYLHSSDSGQPLTLGSNLDRSVLPKVTGDMVAKLAISQYRPGKGDLSQDISQLRIDAVQSFDPMNVLAPLGWATIASITPSKDASKIPTIDALGFPQSAPDPSKQGLKQILLPNGVGQLAINVSQPANSEVSGIVKSASTIVTAVLSELTLPAISVPAVKVFSELFGKWQNRARVIMNGNLTPVIGTSTPPASLQFAQDPMPFPSGYYVMFPQDHEAELTAQFDELTIQNGFLVGKDAPNNLELTDRAKVTVPGVTYTTIRVYTDKAPASSCAKTA